MKKALVTIGATSLCVVAALGVLELIDRNTMIFVKPITEEQRGR